MIAVPSHCLSSAPMKHSVSAIKGSMGRSGDEVSVDVDAAEAMEQLECARCRLAAPDARPRRTTTGCAAPGGPTLATCGRASQG